MINTDDCIAAISTAPGSGGIAIIRLSGENAFFIADKIFCANKKGVLSRCGEIDFSCVSGMADHTIKHGYIFCGNEIIDECLVSKMEAPRTYTAENIVEINSHGGYAVAKRILELCLENGARAAEPGEFTRRAFLNGRIDLTEAEGVMDIINARTEAGRKAAVSELSGALGAEIKLLCDKLTEANADIDVSIDYPEFEFDEEMGEKALSIVNEVLAKLQRLSDSYKVGRLAKEGIKTVIAGAPNAGKSTLMNELVGMKRSIVTDIPGTTRDTVEEQIQIGGFPVVLIDTAGIRDTNDRVEKIGVEIALDKAKDADIVLYMIDLSAENTAGGFDEAEKLLFSEDIISKTIICYNKTDLSEVKPLDFGYNCDKVYISAKNGTGIQELTDLIKEKCRLSTFNAGSEAVITNARHKQLVADAMNLLLKAKESKEFNMPLDFVASDIRLACEKLCEILGKNATDEIVSNIFDRFCVGK